MAGTRGIARFNGDQLRSNILRDRHFDVNNKINEDKVDIQWLNHREILEATKIDVFVQANSQAVVGLSSLDVTSVIGDKVVSTSAIEEGVVLSSNVELRQHGSEDYPYIDADGDRVYGKLRFDNGSYFLDFFSEVGGVEAPYTFAADAVDADFRYVLRTNLSVIPVDALVKGGSGFVEGATDANAYMNLTQLMKDLYGGTGTLDNDGNANLVKSIVQQIADEIQARGEADQAILDDLSSTLAGEGASLVGVVTDTNYAGNTIQSALTDLASRIAGLESNGGAEVSETHSRDLASANGYFTQRTGVDEFTKLEERLVDIETVVDTQAKDKEDRVTAIEGEVQTARGTSASLDERLDGIDSALSQEVQDRSGGDQAIRDDLSSNATGKGASLVGIEDVGGKINATNVEGALIEVADRATNLEQSTTDHETRIGQLETEDLREVFEAAGGETGYTLVNGIARPNTLFISLNGALQAPSINYTEVTDPSGNVTGVTFSPDMLNTGDVLFMWYKKLFT